MPCLISAKQFWCLGLCALSPTTGSQSSIYGATDHYLKNRWRSWKWICPPLLLHSVFGFIFKPSVKDVFGAQQRFWILRKESNKVIWHLSKSLFEPPFLQLYHVHCSYRIINFPIQIYGKCFDIIFHLNHLWMGQSYFESSHLCHHHNFRVLSQGEFRTLIEKRWPSMTKKGISSCSCCYICWIGRQSVRRLNERR